MKRRTWKYVVLFSVIVSTCYFTFPKDATPSNRTIRGAIVTLTRGDSVRLLNMLHSVEYFYPQAIEKYPVVIFYDPHGAEIESFKMDYIRSCVKLKLIFQPIILLQLIQNPTETVNCIHRETPTYHQRPLGYRLMCLFWSHTVFYHPIIRTNYDYIMRLDDDSYLLERMTEDLFEYAHRKHLDYLYRALSWDIPLSGPEFLLPKYLQTYHQTCRTFCFPFHSHQSIYNNFFLTRVQFWHQKSVQNFLNTLLSNDSILIYSLGDGNIHAVVLALASDTKRTEQLFFAYAHNIHLYGKRNRNFNLQHNYSNWPKLLQNHREKACREFLIIEPYEKRLKYISLP